MSEPTFRGISRGPGGHVAMVVEKANCLNVRVNGTRTQVTMSGRWPWSPARVISEEFRFTARADTEAALLDFVHEIGATRG